jgi:transcriptional regulator with XRE-family HTH domain
MVLSDSTLRYFSLIQHRIRNAIALSTSNIPFTYEDEPFFTSYDALYKIWIKRESQRSVALTLNISRNTLSLWEENFINYGTIGLLPELSFIDVDSLLENLVVLIKKARPHENTSLALKLAKALNIPGASSEIIRKIQRVYGYGQRLNEQDITFFKQLQHIIDSVKIIKDKISKIHDSHQRPTSFLNFDKDPFQQRIELFKELSQCEKSRSIRPVLRRYGIHPNRFYELKERYLHYGVWGLVDLIQITKTGEKISAELELLIIENRLMRPQLGPASIIKELDLKCSKALVQKIYSKWKLAKVTSPVMLRGVISEPIPEKIREITNKEISAKLQFPDLINKANLKTNPSFESMVENLRHKKVLISNPGAIIAAPFLDAFGVVEAIHTYGPDTLRSKEITNNIIVNVLRIIAGFPTINDFTLNSDRSVAIASGLSLNPKKSRYYESFDCFRFEHLQKLRNDASCRAKELCLIEGKNIAIDYHCDPVESHYPGDKSLSKAPDKNGNMVYAHRPQIIWDSITNTVINIAYHEGSSRGTSALYRFCESNLFRIIDPDAVNEIYADSEYTGEKQLVYLAIRTSADITMCLKQNRRIKLWKEEVIKENQWESFEKKYRIAYKDYTLAETLKPFRFIVKQDIETGETRCFGSTHIDLPPAKILDYYHIRWPVETGIKNLIEDYFLNNPPGTSPEKVETHYYCIMLARYIVDYFLSLLHEPNFITPEEWRCSLSTIRNTIFSNKNCELHIDEKGDFVIIYLDGDPYGILESLRKLLETRKKMGLNKVSWWGNRGVKIEIKNQYEF